MRTTTLLLYLLILPFLVSGQGAIKGKILDSLTNEPLFMATVAVEVGGVPMGATTDEKGRFTLKPLNTGYYDLTVSYVGKNKYVMENVRVNMDKITFLNPIDLSPIMGDDIIIIGERFSDKERLIKIEDPTAITLVAKHFEKDANIKDPVAMLAKSVPGMYQKEEGQPVYFRGSRSGASQYFVDGVKVRGGNIGIPSSSISSITVYTGGIPAKYGDVTGGIIVVESKTYFELLNEHQDYKEREEQKKKQEEQETEI